MSGPRKLLLDQFDSIQNLLKSGEEDSPPPAPLPPYLGHLAKTIEYFFWFPCIHIPHPPISVLFHSKKAGKDAELQK